MRTERITRWMRIVGENLEIGNFGNDEAIPKSVVVEGGPFGNKAIPGSIILRDEIYGNLVLEDIEIGGHTKITNRVQGMIYMNNFESEGFTFLPKDNLAAEFAARNCEMKGIFFIEGQGAFWSVDLSNSSFEYLFFDNSVLELILAETKVGNFGVGKNLHKIELETNEANTEKELMRITRIFKEGRR